MTKLDASTKAAASVESWVLQMVPLMDVFFQVADFEITVAKQPLPLQNKIKPQKRLQPAVGPRPAPPLPLGHDHGLRKTLGYLRASRRQERTRGLNQLVQSTQLAATRVRNPRAVSSHGERPHLTFITSKMQFKVFLLLASHLI